MQTIETTQVDQYTQTILRDQSMTPAERAQHAAVAISVHVMQEAGLPLDTETPIDDERVDAMEARLEHRAAHAIDTLMDQSMEAWEWLEREFPEDVSGQKLAGAGILYIPHGLTFPEGELADQPAVVPMIVYGEPEATLRLVEDTMEGNSGALMPDTPSWPTPSPEEQAMFNKFWKDES